jgi:DNA-directed RNA polymerase subunit RPC12/RpoP
LIAESIRSPLAQVENIIEDEIEAGDISKDLPAPPEAQNVHAARYICPSCGSKMSYSPKEGLLVCLSCQHRQTPSHQQDLVEEQPFVAAMAALKGHSHPVSTRSLECLACGAVFILAPATLSQSCPYCATAYTVDGEASLALIPPTGLLPFEISQTEASARLQAWFRSEGLSASREIKSPFGIYLPLWTFDLGGSLSWETPGLLFSQSRTQSVYFDDILVPAIRKILEQLVEERGALFFLLVFQFLEQKVGDVTRKTT